MKRAKDIMRRLLAMGLAAILLAGSVSTGAYAEGTDEPESVAVADEGTEESEIISSGEMTETEETGEETSEEVSSEGSEVSSDEEETITEDLTEEVPDSEDETVMSEKESIAEADDQPEVELQAGMGAYADYIPKDGDTQGILVSKWVLFGGYPWYIIEDNSTSAVTGYITLFAAECIGDATTFNDATDDPHYKYSSSNVKRTVDAMTEEGGTLSAVADAIKTVDVDMCYYDNTKYDTVKDVKCYLIDEKTAAQLPQNAIKCTVTISGTDEQYWMTSICRELNDDDFRVEMCSRETGVSSFGDVFEGRYGVRPALQLKLSKVSFSPIDNTFSLIPSGSGYRVTLAGGENATVSGGDTTQTVQTGAMETVTYTANEGHHFEPFADITDNGITAHRVSDTVVTVSGTPTDDAAIRVPDAVDYITVKAARVTSGQSSKEFGKFEDAVTAWNEAGAGATLTLLKDITTGSTVKVQGGTEGSPMILDLNDHGILFTGESIRGIVVPSKLNYLRLTDSKGSGSTRYITTDESGRGTSVSTVKPSSGIVVSVQGGYITGASNVGVYNDGSFEMLSGTIIANISSGSTANGGGVHNSGVKFTMNGGMITYNCAKLAGGGVNSAGGSSFIMNGGMITHNSAKTGGGGVFHENESANSFVMNGGEISYNTSGITESAVGNMDAIGFIYNTALSFTGNIFAGEKIDGSDAKAVTPNHARFDCAKYGFIRIADDVFTHDPIEKVTYTGKAISPDVTVRCGTTVLEKNKDYTIKFSNNTNAGKEAKLTITGKGNYSGTVTDTFEIGQKSLSDGAGGVNEEIGVSIIPSVAYNSKKTYQPVPVITYNGKKLKKDKDFEVSYYVFEDSGFENALTPKEPGHYSILVKGIGNFTDSIHGDFRIASSTQTPVSKLTVSKIKDQDYTGAALCPEPTVKNGNTGLEKDTDYSLYYVNNTEIGTATIYITGMGENYIGTRTVTFKIKGIPMKKVSVKGIPKSETYTGTAHKPGVTLSYKAGSKAPVQNIDCVPKDLYEGLTEEQKADVDCLITYGINTDVGTATVTLTGIHGCTGTVKKTFKITPYPIDKDQSDIFTVTLAEETYPYAKGGVKPKPVVKFMSTVLTEGRDYTLSYANNTSVNDGSGKKKPTVKVTGKGNFKGTDTTTTFKIGQADMTATGVTVSAKDVVFKDKAGKWTTKFSLAGPDGKALKAGKDYDNKTVLYSYDAEGTNIVKATDTVPAGTTIYIKVNAKGTLYSGSATGSYRVVEKDISKLSASVAAKEFTGKEIRLNNGDITWKSGKNKVTDVEFEIDPSTYKNNTNKGKATVIVKGKGAYGGTKKVTFKIGTKGIFWGLLKN